MIKPVSQTIFRPLLFVIVVLLSSSGVKSQTALTAGDMAFVSFKWSGDGWQAVTFKILCPGTIIYITDNPYRNTGGFCTSQEESCYSLTITTTVPAGAKITCLNSGTNGVVGTFSFSPSGAGTGSTAFVGQGGTNDGYSTSGDNLFIFQGSYYNPTFICGIKTSAYQGSGGVTCSNRGHSELPSSLTVGTNTLISSPGGNDRTFYNCTVSNSTTAALRAAICNSANWSNDNAALNVACSFTVTDAPANACTPDCSCNIWSEDFNTTRYPSRATTGTNSNGANPAADWTTTASDCDDGSPFGTLTQSYWGTNGGVFTCNDVEGPCGSCSPGGDANNEWLSEQIDISWYTTVSICVNIANSGTMEANTSTNQCNNSDDIIQGQYRINSGAWVTWFFDDAAVNGATATVSGLSGGTLQIRFYLGNKANDEFYTIDNVCVSGTLSPMPVKFTDFNVARLEYDQALVSWTTASETNNNYFQVERSFDSRNWESIGIVSGNGTTSQPHSYSFVDEGPLSPLTYYRLKQVDFNGEFEYTPIRVLQGDQKNPIVVVPNPSNDFFTVTGLEEDLATKVFLYNCSGQIVQVYETDQAMLVIPAYTLEPGIYFAEVVYGNRVDRFRLVRSSN